MVAIFDKIIGEDHETIIEITIDKTITEETTEETIIENKGIEIAVAVEIIAGIPTETENSTEDYALHRHYSGDRSRTSQLCSQLR